MNFKPILAVNCGVLDNVAGVNLCTAASGQNGYDNVISAIITFMIGLVGIVLTITVLISAIQYVTAAGDSNRVKSAKDRLVQASVGLGLLILLQGLIIITNSTIVEPAQNVTEISQIEGIANNVANVLMGVVGALAVIFIIIGGIRYITSSGDPNKVTSAKSTIGYAIGGLVLALSLRMILTLINTLFF